MDIVNGCLLPIGFKELIDCLGEQSTMVQAKEIQKELSSKFKFSSGKVAGTIKRAEEKGLLSRLGYGVYQYNAEKLKEYHIHSTIAPKATANSKATPVPKEPKTQSTLDKINAEILNTVKKCNEIIALDTASLSVEAFKQAKEKINALEELAR